MTWALVVWDVFAVVFWLKILYRVAARPVGKYDLRWVGKIATIAVVVYGSTILSGWLLPVGAVVIWWRARNRYEEPEIPIADGWPGKVG